ncbi:hypothetical protein [Gloeobacter kilaueensis]|uniref:hypothetical protein n=1 Tax=Gloeobacter kilaueensis TaxID=1416614 RepID=UPI0003FAA756|nr:hypothetical protein [Gloeobacter kilaueensis]
MFAPPSPEFVVWAVATLEGHIDGVEVARASPDEVAAAALMMDLTSKGKSARGR